MGAKIDHKKIPGGLFEGRPTTAHLVCEKRIIPYAVEILKWIEENHVAMQMTRTLAVNQLLTEAIKRRDPKWKAPDIQGL